MPNSQLYDAVNPPGFRKVNSAGRVTQSAASTTTRIHQVGTGKTAIITKIWVVNTGTIAVNVNIGDTADGTTAGAFTQRLPTINLVGGETRYITENDIPLYEFNATNNILFQLSAASACEIMIDVAEK